MIRALGPLAFAALVGLQGAAAAGQAELAPVWGVGRLPIECVMAPCVTKGIFPLNPAARAEAGVIWFNQVSPPPMLGPAALIRAISAAYDRGECLRVSGSFVGERLTVVTVDGRC